MYFQLVAILVEEKNDILAFANYKDTTGDTAPIKNQEKKCEIKVEAISEQHAKSQTQTSISSQPNTGKYKLRQYKKF